MNNPRFDWDNLTQSKFFINIKDYQVINLR